MAELPRGTVTFLLTDVEGSTALWERDPQAMQQALARHDAIMTEIIGRHGGVVVKSQGEGDSVFAVFGLARDAVVAAADLQRALQGEPWRTDTPLRVRMALHTGEAELRDGDFFGSAVNRAARLRAAAHGGQVLLSHATEQLVRDGLISGLGLRDLGDHRLRDLERPERIFQLTIGDLPLEMRPVRTLDILPNNLPTQLTSFVGREREMAEIRSLLAAVRLLTLVGAGGAGKTRLALQVAAGLGERFPDGIWLIELAALVDATLVPQAVASALGVRDASGRSLTVVLAEHLQAKRVLLILDNCEHHVGTCAELADALLHASPSVHILATSRESLAIGGETTWRVPSLLLPDPHHLPPIERLSAFEAVRLFVERAVAAVPGFGVTNANAPFVAQICQQLDGIPLAIELAAVRVKVLTPEQISARLDDRFRLLTGGSRTALPRQQTLRALVDWSHDLLSEPEQLLFRRLAVFAGGWTLEAAEEVCSDDHLRSVEILDLMIQLVNKSLVLAEERQGVARYRLLETLRQYGVERLRAAGEEEERRRRHRDWVLAEVVRQVGRFGGAGQASALMQMDGEYGNVRVALDWCEAEPDGWELGARIVDELGWYLGLRALIREGRERIGRVLGRARGQTEGQARALSVAGKLEHHSGNYEQSAAYFEASLAIWRELGDVRGLAICLGRYGQLQQARGDFDHAWSLLTECQELFQALGTQSALDAALEVFLAQVAKNRGDDAEAIRQFESCLAPLRAQGDTHSVWAVLRSLGELVAARGEYDRAALCLLESLSLAREIDDQPCSAQALDVLAIIESGKGETIRAVRLWAAAQASREAQGLTISPAEQERIDQAAAAARTTLEPDAFREVWEMGASLSLDEAVAYALERG